MKKNKTIEAFGEIKSVLENLSEYYYQDEYIAKDDSETIEYNLNIIEEDYKSSHQEIEYLKEKL